MTIQPSTGWQERAAREIKHMSFKHEFDGTPATWCAEMEREERAIAAIIAKHARSAQPVAGKAWIKASDVLPEMPVIVWVSQGGGTALLARYDRYRWESATSLRDLPFAPVWWKPLDLPESPAALASPPIIHCSGDGSLTSDHASP